MKQQLAVVALAGLMLAQASPSYNGGIPMVPGTSVPESNPAIDRPLPSRPAPSAPSPSYAPAESAAPPASGNAGPAYSFGAAPPPVVAPGR